VPLLTLRGAAWQAGGMVIAVPPELAAAHARIWGDQGRAWTAALPTLASSTMERWSLRPDGPGRHGLVSLVLPVVCDDGTPAALKLQPLDDETAGEPVGLREWNGQGTVLLLDHDPASGAMLLERLDASRPLGVVENDLAALQPLAEIMARLVSVAAPPDLRRLADIAAAMLAAVPGALRVLGVGERRLVGYCAGAVAELVDEPGDRMLHWDLHYDNVLAGTREPWLAIDPKPLAGDPCFELLPALHNRWDDVLATGDVARAVKRRFDLMVEVVGLDRERAVGWTLGRVLQNALWDVEDGEVELDRAQVAIAAALTGLSTND
jgi:streptomycin 6-kinase